MPPHDPAPVIRLSLSAPRRDRRAGACPDATVAAARRMVETTSETLVGIARGLGISVSTVSRWALDSNWARPPTAPRWSSRFDPHDWGKRRSPRLFEARRGLREAEFLLQRLEAAPPPVETERDAALGRLEETLARLDAATAALRKPGSDGQRGAAERCARAT